MLRTVILASALVAAAPATAATTVIDFNQLSSTYTTGPVYEEDGFRLTAPLCSAGYACFRPAAADVDMDPVGNAVFRQGGSTSTTVERIGGGAFTFDSIQFGKTSITNNTASSTYVFTFDLAAGGQATRYYTFNWNNPSPVTVNTATFTGLGEITRFSFRNQSTAAQFDNITLSTVAAAVPEPATWAMMIGGMGVVGGSLRRRSTKVRFAA